MEQPAILMPLFYCPPVSWFAALANAPVVYLEQHEHYVKGSYRNRCHIAAVNGVQRLTVPLRKGKNQQQPIREVRISYDEPWQAQHWQAIRSAYGNSPFFEHYADELEPFFKEKKYEFLFDLNLDLLLLVKDLLKLKTQVSFTESWLPDAPENAVDFRNQIHPKKTGGQLPAATYYPQVFEDRHGFLKNLSVLDLLFCSGPGAMDTLRS